MRFIGLIRQENSLSQPANRVESSWFGPVYGIRPACGIERLFAAAVLCVFAASAAAQPTAAAEDAASGPETQAPQASQQLVNSPLQPMPDYANSTDHELTRLGARWDLLSAPERQALLKEVKLRMAQRKVADGVLMIRTQRRYGRVYSSNGRYLKIETKVIRVRPAGSGGSVPATSSFGVGFEKRNSPSAPAERPGQGSEPTGSPLDSTLGAPVVRVDDPSG